MSDTQGKLNDTLPKLFTLEELAAAARENIETPRRHVRAGHLPAVRLGKGYRVSREVAEAYLTGQFRTGGR